MPYCPIDHCVRYLKIQSGLTQHLARIHPEWQGPAEPLSSPVDQADSDPDGDPTNQYRTPLHRQRALAVQMLPRLTPL